MHELIQEREIKYNMEKMSCVQSHYCFKDVLNAEDIIIQCHLKNYLFKK